MTTDTVTISRYYSPELGRWLGRDPIGERGGWNIYAMVGNNTLNRWDLLGLRDIFCSTVPIIYYTKEGGQSNWTERWELMSANKVLALFPFKNPIFGVLGEIEIWVKVRDYDVIMLQCTLQVYCDSKGNFGIREDCLPTGTEKRSEIIDFRILPPDIFIIDPPDPRTPQA